MPSNGGQLRPAKIDPYFQIQYMIPKPIAKFDKQSVVLFLALVYKSPKFCFGWYNLIMAIRNSFNQPIPSSMDNPKFPKIRDQDIRRNIKIRRDLTSRVSTD